MTTRMAVVGRGMPGEGRPIAVGSRVRLIDNYGVAEFIMVPVERAGRAGGTGISVGSHLGLALLGHRAGDRVEVRTLLGIQVVTILDVL
jgi:transcription elongation GreA/GreB family factor